jgi:hypothetical protein
MRIPLWLTLVVVFWVLLWGSYRIYLGFRSKAEDVRARARGGLFGMSKRTHILWGIIYLLLGAGLLAGVFGWTPLAGLFGNKTQEPPAAQSPTSGGVLIDNPTTHK